MFRAAIPVSVFFIVIAAAFPLWAKEWPSQPITMHVGLGSRRLLGHGEQETLADSMTKRWGCP